MTEVSPATPPVSRLETEVGRRARPTWLPVWLGSVGLITVTVLAIFEPAGQFFFPRCSFYALTGWQCSGCGMTRAIHALLRGRLTDAWRLNPLGILSLPLLAWTYLAWLVNDLGNRQWPQPLANRFLLAVFLGIVAGFGIARNLPWNLWLSR